MKPQSMPPAQSKLVSVVVESIDLITRTPFDYYPRSLVRIQCVRNDFWPNNVEVSKVFTLLTG